MTCEGTLLALQHYIFSQGSPVSAKKRHALLIGLRIPTLKGRSEFQISRDRIKNWFGSSTRGLTG